MMKVRSSVRNAKKRRPADWRKMFFRLNVFPAEHDCDNVSFEEEGEEDGETRFLKMSVASLEAKLTQTNQQLQASREHSGKVEETNASLGDKNKFLQNRLAAAEKESDETNNQKVLLEARVKELESQAQKEEKQKKLGNKRFCELGPSAVKKTRTAYNNQFKDKINSYGETRGLMLERLILSDENGDQLVVNAERPRTFENLTAGEKRRVDRVLRWKDLKRISDAAYADIKRTDGTSLPCTSHVEQQEKQLNAHLPTIHQVPLFLNLTFLVACTTL